MSNTSSTESEQSRKPLQGRRSSLSMVQPTTSARSFERPTQGRRSSLNMTASSTRSFERTASQKSCQNGRETSLRSFGELSLSSSDNFALTVSNTSFSSSASFSVEEEEDAYEASLGDFAFDPDFDDNENGAAFGHHASFSGIVSKPLQQQQPKIAPLVKMNQSMSALHAKFCSSAKLQPSPQLSNSGDLYSSQRWLIEDQDKSDSSVLSMEGTIEWDPDKSSKAGETQKQKNQVKKKTLPKKDVTGAEFARLTKKRQSRAKQKLQEKKTSDEEEATVDTLSLTPSSGHSSMGSTCSLSTHSQHSRHSDSRHKGKKRGVPSNHNKGLISSSDDDDSFCNTSQASLASAVEEIKPDNRLSKIVLQHMKKMQQQQEA